MENSKIIKEIKKLRKDITPRKEFVSLNRDFLLREISSQLPAQNVKIGLAGYFQFVTQIFRQHVFEPAVVMFMIFGVFLSSSFTINAAFYSMPGSPLYRLKIALENTHAAMTPNDNQRVELKIEFAQKRVEELDRIVASQDMNSTDKKEQIEAIATEFKNNVSAVKDHLAKLSQNINQPTVPTNKEEKEKTLRMAMTLNAKAQDLVQSLDKKVNLLSDKEKLEVKTIIDEAIESAKQTGVSAQQLLNEAQVDNDKSDVKSVNNETSTSTKSEIDSFSNTSTPKTFIK